MGYYSDFVIDDYEGDLDEFRDLLDSVTDRHWYVYSDDSGVYLSGTKWYDWDTDLDHLAKTNELNFTVVRYGEEQPDISRIVVSPGQTRLEQAIISWPT